MVSKLSYPQVWMLLLSIIVADWSVALLIRLSRGIGALDRPHSYKIHREEMPFLGGIGVFVGFAVALFTIVTIPSLASLEANRQLLGILLGAVIVMVLGCIDDFRPLPATFKLACLFGVTLLLLKFDVTLTLTRARAFDVGLTLFWIAGMASAVNSLDNMDGAALGVSAVASFFAFLVAWDSYQTQFSFVAIALCGACVGALRHNFKPARIFIGDNGSLLLGFLLASMMVMGGWAHGDPWKAVLLPCIILVVPLYDITLSTVLRYKNGVVRSIRQAIVYCGRDHVSHRLVALGLSQREAVLTLYLFGIAGGMIAYSLASEKVGPSVYWPVIGAGIVVLGCVGAMLDHADVYGVRPEAVPPAGDAPPAAPRPAPGEAGRDVGGEA